MSKEEQIALELVKVIVNNTPDSVRVLNKGVMELYKSFVNELKDLKKEENDITKLQDEVSTYRYILESIRNLMNRDANNFVLKEELNILMRGVE